MDSKRSQLIERPLSSADQSINERGHSDTINSSIEKLEFLSEKSWKTVNFDLDSAVYFSKVIRKAKITNISQSDLYLFVPLLRVLTSARNFKFNKEFTVSLTTISNLILCDAEKQASIKRIKKLLLKLSSIQFEDQTYVLEYKKRDGLLPVIKLHQSIVFNRLKMKTDYVMIPRKAIKEHVYKLITKPKAFSLYLELFFIISKRKVKACSSGMVELDSYQQKTDRRLNLLFSTKAHHSLEEVKKDGKKYLGAIIGADYIDAINDFVEKAVSPDCIQKYSQVKFAKERQDSYKYFSSDNTLCINNQFV